MNMKTFVIDSKLSYREIHLKDRAINKFYELDNPGVALNTIPDACIDLQFVWKENRYIPFACGSFLESTDSPTGHVTHCFGVKFNPGMVPKSMRQIVSNLISSRISLDGLEWLMNIAEELAKADTFEERVEIFRKEFPFKEEICEENGFIEFAMKRIQQEKGCLNISALAMEMGYNQKYMDRVFREATGITMKKYASIIRIQKAIHYLQEDRFDEVYEQLGYYDQSHFIKDFKRFTCMTPNQYNRKNKSNIV